MHKYALSLFCLLNAAEKAFGRRPRCAAERSTVSITGPGRERLRAAKLEREREREDIYIYIYIDLYL